MNGLVRKFELQFLLRAKFTTTARFITNWFTNNEHLRDSYDYTHLLHECRSPENLKLIHAQIIIGGYEQNPFIATKLIAKCMEFANSSMEVARKVFDRMPQRDVLLFNQVIKGFAIHGPLEKALSCFDQLRASGVAANEYTIAYVLKACWGLKEFQKGQVIHAQIVKSCFDSDQFVSNALVAFYGKCQRIDSSKRVFDEMQERDIVSWNSMISAYVFNGLSSKALELFRIMLVDGEVSPDHVTLVGILSACAQESAVNEGMWVHSHILKQGLDLDAALGSSLVSMYANSGRLKTAKLVFDQVSDKNIVVWNAMIWAYGIHGHASEALKLFSELEKTGVHLDGIIFLCLLSACSHSGMVSEGCELFEKMEAYGIEKTHGHYACMIDLYSRAGLIEEAMEFVKNMPIEAGKDAYGALLNSCRIHNDIEVAEEVAKKLFELDPENAGRYMILVKMYNDAGQYEKAARLRKVLQEKNIRTIVGYSAIEVDHTLHTFRAEDESHPCKEHIFETLHKMEMVMEDERMTFDQFLLVS